MSDNFQKIYHRTKAFPWQTMGEDTLIIEPKNQMSHEITGVGSFIWELVDGVHSTAHIIDQACLAFEASPQVIESDVLEFLETLETKGLIQCPQV